MSRCIIITSYIEGNLSDFLHIASNDFIICADGGYQYARRAGITPHLLMGDFDSITEEVPSHIETRTFSREKDDTDTGLCVKAAIESGYQDILIVGGLGGRFDHSVANLQTMASAAAQIKSVAMIDEKNFVTILINSRINIPRKTGYHLSLFSFSEKCQGVSVSGVHYPLSHYTMTNQFPLGVSNEFEADEAIISVENGTLLIVLSSD